MHVNAREVLTRLLCEQLGCEPNAVVDDAHILRDLGADSIDMVELGLALEDAFGINISKNDLGEIETVAQAVTLLSHRLATVEQAS
jgi:acyl carrier protein